MQQHTDLNQTGHKIQSEVMELEIGRDRKETVISQTPHAINWVELRTT